MSALSITVNGELEELPVGTTVLGLIEKKGLTGGRIAVERNRAIVPRAAHGSTELANGDVLELVTFVGGG